MTQGDGKEAEAPDDIAADLFTDRHPSLAEQDWAATTLAAALRSHPEVPIGAAEGGNRESGPSMSAKRSDHRERCSLPARSPRAIGSGRGERRVCRLGERPEAWHRRPACLP